MANPIKPKRSYTPSSVPTTSDLQTHELALNWNDGKVFTKDAAGNIVTWTLGSGGGGGGTSWVSAPASATASGTPGQMAYDANGYFYICTAPSTWKRVALSSWVAGDPYFSSVYLLLHGDGNLNDSSPYENVVTAYGNTAATGTAKFGGNSVAFDGTGDYLTVPAPTFGSGNWVVEGWFYPTGSLGGTLFTARSSTAVVGGPTVVIDGTGLLQFFIASSDNSTWQIAGTSSGISLTLNSWQHVAIVRSGSTLRAYKDGVGGTAVTISDGIGTSGAFSLMAGSAAGGQEVAGYVDDFRVTIGTDRGYTSTVTVPTAAFPDTDASGNRPDPYFGNVSLLLHADGTGNTFVDSSSYTRVVTAYGNATQSATHSKFGGKSAYFDGSGDYLSLGENAAFTQWGNENWTVELWFRAASVSAYGPLFSASGRMNLHILSQKVYLNNAVDGVGGILTSEVLSANTWHHVVAVRSGSTCSLYVDGTLAASGDVPFGTGPGALNIGGDASSSFSGYIDEVRHTRGVARYTGSTITVPTAAFPDA